MFIIFDADCRVCVCFVNFSIDAGYCSTNLGPDRDAQYASTVCMTECRLHIVARGYRLQVTEEVVFLSLESSGSAVNCFGASP